VTYPGASRETTDVLKTEYTPYGLPFSSWLDSDDARTDLVHPVSYDLHGHVTRIDYGNGWSDRFAYTSTYEMSRLRCTRTAPYLADGTACSGGVSDLRREEIVARDAAGNTLSIDDLRHGGTALDHGSDVAYDALGRLLESHAATGAIERFAYDGSGNLLSSTATGALTYAPGEPNLATGVGGATIAHDAAGNRTAKGSWRYAYDGLGRLSEVSDRDGLVSRNHYDEGASRVARYDAVADKTTFYFGGLLEVDGTATTRHFHFMNRVIATDTTSSDRTASPANAFGLGTVLGPAASSALPAFLLLGALSIGLIRGPRQATAALTTIVFTSAMTLLPFTEARAASSRTNERSAARRMLFIHADERGSPELLTDATGGLVERRRYSSYGRLTEALDASGQVVADEATTFRFNGHTSDRDAGLVYFGSRFYDPDLGLFLTPDPQAQYASPYLYGGGNPIYGVDPDGEAIFAFLVAVLQPIVASAVVSSFVSAVTAAAQGGDVAGALVDGFVSGAAGAALGTALSGANVAYQYVAGGAEFIELGEALGAVVEAARRSAFTNVVSQTAASASRAAGADSEWATVVDFGVKLLGSYIYDNFVIRASGGTLGSGATQRAAAKTGLVRANTTAGHTSVTEEAALGTGWESQSMALAKANVAEDGIGGIGTRINGVLNNQAHFGRLPATLEKIQAELDGLVAGSASKLLGVTSAGAPTGFVHALGAASHYVQDHLTLGHMVPGTALFGGPLGAPVRFVIHQVFGGEVAFRRAQVRATRSLLASYGAPA
jgi:RHS repeat-associated protein